MNLSPKSKTSQAVAAYLAEKQRLKLSPPYLKGTRESLQLLLNVTADPTISTIPLAGIQNAVSTGSKPWLMKSRFDAYCGFFEWARRNNCLAPGQPNPMTALNAPVVDAPPVMPYSVDDARDILAGTQDPFHVVPAVLAAFAGLQRMELREVEWPALEADKFRIADPEGIRPVRLVPKLPVLGEWLEPFARFNLEGPIYCGHIVAIAPPKLLPIAVQVRRLRVTFILHRFGMTGDLEQTAQEAGISRYNGQKILKRSAAEAGAYFRLTPAVCGRKHWVEEVAASMKRRRPH